MINKTSEETIRAILRKSPWALPDDPAGAGMAAEDIKKNFWRYLIDEKYSAIAELARVIREMNSEIEAWKDELIGDIPNLEELCEDAASKIEALRAYEGIAEMLEVYLTIALDNAYEAEKIASGAAGKAEKKVTKHTDMSTYPARVYAEDRMGHEVLVPVSYLPEENAAAFYSIGGVLKAGMPQEDDDAATKEYTDNVMRRSV